MKTQNTPISDDELYIGYLNGDESAIGELMIRYGDRLTLFLHAFLHNWHDAEDMTVEAFARIMVKKPLIREGGFRAYLYRTARNFAIKHKTAENRLKTFSLDGMENELSDGGTIDELFQNGEKRKAVSLCLDRIDPRLKEALWLVYVEDLSYKDAAEVMKVSTKRVDKLLQNGKEHMRRELCREGVFSS